jgi:NADPH:quinone reductase-like Zn-dependent oxidoreductase
VKVPESIDPASTACLAENYLAAFQILHLGQRNGTRYKKSALKRKSFLVLGCMTSNMGRAIAELALDASVQHLYALAKEKHHSQLTALGAIPLSPNLLEWWEKLAGKIDVIICLEGDLTNLHYKLLKENGQVIVARHCRRNAKTAEDILERRSTLVCMLKTAQQKNKCRTHIYDVYKEWEDDFKTCKRDLEHLLQKLQGRHVVPHLLDRIPLTKVGKAQELIETKNLSGFIVCEPWIVSKSRAVRL